MNTGLRSAGRSAARDSDDTPGANAMTSGAAALSATSAFTALMASRSENCPGVVGPRGSSRTVVTVKIVAEGVHRSSSCSNRGRYRLACRRVWGTFGNFNAARRPCAQDRSTEHPRRDCREQSNAGNHAVVGRQTRGSERWLRHHSGTGFDAGREGGVAFESIPLGGNGVGAIGFRHRHSVRPQSLGDELGKSSKSGDHVRTPLQRSEL